MDFFSLLCPFTSFCFSSFLLTLVLLVANLCLCLVAGKVVEEPDIHLILEYPSGASWGPYSSRRANRYAAVNWQ